MAVSSRLAAVRARAFCAWLALALGINLAALTPLGSYHPAFAACIVLALGALALLSRALVCRVALLLALVALGLVTAGISFLHLSPASLAHVLSASTPLEAQVTGIALDRPAPVPPPGGSLGPFAPSRDAYRFRLRVVSISRLWSNTPQPPQPAAGIIWVRVNASLAPPLAAGSAYTVTGRLLGLPPPANPGEFDQRPAALDRGLVGSLFAASVSDIQPAPAADSDSAPLTLAARRLDSLAIHTLDAFRARARAAVNALFPDLAAAPLSPSEPAAPSPLSLGTRAASHVTADESRALLMGLLLGNTDASDPELSAAFTRLGLLHVLSISGFHLTLLAAFVLSLLRLTGDRGPLEPLLTALVIAAYALLVPPAAPIVRSALMLLGLLLAEAFGRRYDRLTILLWIACLLLLWHPSDLWSLGYQLSFGLTAALLWLGPRVRQWLLPSPVRRSANPELPLFRRLNEHAQELVTSSMLCWTLAAPLLILRTGLFSPLAILTTILITPLITLLLALAYLALFVGLISPTLASYLAPLVQPAASAVIALVLRLDSLPGASLTVPPVPAAAALYALVLAALWFRRAQLWNLRLWLAAALPALALAVAALVTRPASSLAPPTFHALAVGAGSCSVFHAPSPASGPPAVLLWNCGSTRTSLGIRTVPAILRALHVWRTPTVVLSSPDLADCAGIIDLLRPLQVERVLVGPAFFARARFAPAGPAAVILRELQARGITVTTVARGDSLTIGPATVRFLWPPRTGLPVPADPHPSDGSLVALIESPAPTGTHRLLLTSRLRDAELAALRTLEPTLTADVVELPRAGLPSAAAIEFVAALNPHTAFASTSALSPLDPRWDRLRPGRTFFTTGADGLVTLSFPPAAPASAQPFITRAQASASAD